MEALVVVESWFGNTLTIAESVAEGIIDGGGRARVVKVEDAEVQIPDDVDLLIIGAPTHIRGLSTSQTRQEASSGRGGPGVREWIETVELREGLRLALFDTAASMRWLAGSAAKAAARKLTRREPHLSAEIKSFVITGKEGPLKDGETQAAHQWGQSLASS
ncbi:flavodoxin family protein [Bogoriella caseilytica]|uniref:Flavodoxin-like protein n=1 Tax=Bogoriella caseilytica TaxID=56055 RepID=A0A3N2BED7_9MICO|nr:flavodoxin family protein [Bogoriella caseilytica]ROR73414.1 flavodoxin-like protein [Bogoriella caseilytica]